MLIVDSFSPLDKLIITRSLVLTLFYVSVEQ